MLKRLDKRCEPTTHFEAGLEDIYFDEEKHFVEDFCDFADEKKILYIKEKYPELVKDDVLYFDIDEVTWEDIKDMKHQYIYLRAVFEDPMIFHEQHQLYKKGLEQFFKDKLGPTFDSEAMSFK